MTLLELQKPRLRKELAQKGFDFDVLYKKANTVNQECLILYEDVPIKAGNVQYEDEINFVLEIYLNETTAQLELGDLHAIYHRINRNNPRDMETIKSKYNFQKDLVPQKQAMIDELCDLMRAREILKSVQDGMQITGQNQRRSK